MNSSRPYLIRALHEWILDNECTPYAVVNTADTRVRVPAGFEQDDRIVLNISPTAVQSLLIDNEGLSFNARFSGTVFAVYAPIENVLAIYARENGQGMVFDAQTPGGETAAQTDEDSSPDPDDSGGGGPQLRVIK